MRVIAGKYRSRTLRSLKGQALRPTSDRLRETLFNILGADVEDSIFIDLYAGTGAVGIEAISRGACQAIFVEKHKAAVAAIRQNLESLGISVEAHVLAAETIRGLKRLGAQALTADYIFLDPPYSLEEEYAEVLDWVGHGNLLGASGKLIAEHSRKLKLPKRVGRLEFTRAVEQGDSTLTFFNLKMNLYPTSS